MYGQLREPETPAFAPNEGKDAMEKLGSGLYRCKVCGETVETGPHHDPPLSVLVSCPGQPDQRLVMINGYEIHRCPFPVPDPQLGVRGA